jgi:hypothetical protein
VSKTKQKRRTITFPGGWELFGDSLRAYREHPWRYLLIVGIIAVPTNLIGLSSSLASDPTVVLYLNLASLFMTAALLWAVANGQDNVKFKLRQAYYDGSVILVRFILVVAMLALMVLPGAIGLSLYGLGTASTVAPVSVAVQLLLGGLAILLFIPTLVLLVRFIFSIYRVIVEGDWPIAALSHSWRSTRGSFWPLTGRLALLVVWIVLAMLAPLIVLVGLAVITHLYFFIVLLQLAFSLLAVPLICLYTFRLYQVLQGV